jgi:MFS superfamily sulfate permease-like transporter
MATFVGMTVLGLAAWRAGFFHWAPTLLIPFALVFPIVVPIGVVQGIGQGIALGVFLLAVGITVLRMTDQEWVSGTRGAGR